MTREEARRYWTARYEAARKWDDPHLEASERKEHRRYVDALNMAIEALQQVTGKLRNPDDSLLTEDTEDSKKQKSKLDLISRQDAIDRINGTGYAEQIKDNLIFIIRLLPSAEPKTGKWILDPNGMDWNIPAWRCSECGFVANYIGVEAKGFGNNPMNWAGSKFCPQCGARITGYER